MAEITEYLPVEDAIFLQTIEWAFVEQTLPDVVRNEYTTKGWPFITLAGKNYAYMPIVLNGKEYKCIQGNRPKTGMIINDD